MFPALKTLPRLAICSCVSDSKHTARSTKEWLEEHDISTLPWPAQSPDLNPIEHIWNELDRRVRNSQRTINNANDLWEVIQDEWEAIEPEFVLRLIDTMTERIAGVIRVKGGFTRW